MTHKLGINLAGVEMVLKLKKQLSKMQKDMNKLFEQTHIELSDRETEQKDIVRFSAGRLSEIRNSKAPKDSSPVEPKESSKQFDIDDWEIEYE